MMPRTNKATMDIDAEIGKAIRTVRTVKGLSQTTLGEKVGVTFQQVQKYEKGTNRLSVATMIGMCQALDVSPMDLIGPLVGQKTELTGLVGQINELKRRMADIARIATKG